jgi:hypothetical protein
MKYIISENRIKSLIYKYLDKMEWEAEDVGDLVVYGDKKRIFDTFDEYLAINPEFLDTMEGFFGENTGQHLMEWFNENFDHPVIDFGAAEFYNDEDDEDEEEDW